jgi:hypothetical protein
MRPFEVNGHRYIRINGKSFYLLRGYAIRHDKYVFVQVFGRSALTKDDLPEKNWDLVSTKGPQGRVYTAWKPGFFDGSNETRLFLGATREASFRLLLTTFQPHVDVARALAAAFRTEDDRYNVGEIKYDTGITTYDDKGNSGVPAFAVDRAHALTTWVASLTEAPCPTH